MHIAYNYISKIDDIIFLPRIGMTNYIMDVYFTDSYLQDRVSYCNYIISAAHL